MAVDVSRIPNNNKFDPVREAILDLQTQLEEEGQIAYDGTLTLSEGTAVTLTGGSTFTANQSGDTTITIGVDLSVTTNAASGGGSLSYLDGEFTYTPPDLSGFIALTDLSITTSSTPSGGGALSYDDTTGVFTFTPADAGTGLTLQQVTANGNSTTYGISTGNITVQPSGTGSGVVTIQANSVGDARLDLTAGTGGTGVIKTTNNVAITFEPNATEKVVIASDGNMNVYEKLAVGKTTAASTYSLEVDGTALARTFKAQMEASGTTYTGTIDQYNGSLQIRTDSGGTISLGGSGPTSVQNNVFIKDGDLDVNGDVTADFFIGDGSQLTNLPNTGTSSTLQDVTDNGASTTNQITINNDSSDSDAPSLTITSSSASGYGRLLFDGSTTVAGVINRGVAGSDLYFDETSDTGKYYFRSSGRGYFYGDLSVGTTDADGKLVVRGDANSGMVSFFKNLDTGTTSYAEVIVRSVDSDNDLRLGSSKSYADSQWVGGWVFAPRTLLLKSNNDVNIFAGGTANSNIVATFAGSSISLNKSTEVTGKVTITGSPAIELTGSGTGTYNKTVIYNDQTYGFLVEGTKATDSGSAAKKPITLTWRGGYNSNGGLNLTGDTKLYTNDTGLGINKTSASYTLDVAGTVRLGTNESTNSVILMGDGSNAIYMGATNINTINVGYDKDNDDYNLHINYKGYQSGSTRFRSLVINDGKTGDIAKFVGSTGRFGVGIMTPQEKVHIKDGNLAIQNGLFYLGTEGGIDNDAFELYKSGRNLRLYTRLNHFGGTPSNSYANLELYSGGSYATRISGNSDSYFANGANVGIGITSPAAKLDITNNDSATSLLIRNGDISSGSNNEAQIQFGYNGATTFSHFIRTRHNSADEGGNAIDFYTCDSTENNSITSGVRHNLTLDSGKVGIGETIPAYVLDVRSGTVASSFIAGDGGYTAVRFDGDAGATVGSLTTHNGLIYLGSENSGGTGSNGEIRIEPSSGGSAIYIDSSKNVGIGTTSPDKKLHVDGGDLKVRDAGNVSIQIVSSTSDNSAIQFGDDSDVNDGRIVYENTGNNMLFYTNDAEKMRITSGGNVGIGTTTPETKLVAIGDIGFGEGYNGGVYANDTLTNVDTNWGLEVQKTSGVDDYNVRLKFYPDASSARKLGLYNSRGDNWILYADGSTNGIPNVIIPNSNLGVGQTNINFQTSGRRVLELNGSSEALMSFAINGSWQYYIQTTTSGIFHSSGGKNFVIDTGSSNVGIGITSPLNKLSVVARNDSGYYLDSSSTVVIQDYFPTLLIAHDANDTDHYAEIKLGNNHSQYFNRSAFIRGVQGGGINQYRLEFGTSNISSANTKMTLDFDGRLGIGRSPNSSYKLDVAGVIRADTFQVNPQEYGVSMVGNFGQWQAHETYQDFNTVPAYWGWNYIQGNTNAPNSSSSQWYRGRFSLGDQYGLGTGSGDYWMEIAVPRYNYAGGDAGQMFVRACEDGVEGSWYQVGRKIIGDFTATGDVVAYGSSDKRLKDNITPIPNAIEKVQSIGGYEFDWNDNQETYEGHDVGVIAQEVEDIMPEVVTTREDGYKAVKYEKMVPLLIEAIKEQQKQIDELKARLDGST